MPAKPKLLPQPCPICNRENGTVQITIFKNEYGDGDVVLRIGHYSPELYKNPKTRHDGNGTRKTRGKFWHIFRGGYLGEVNYLKNYYSVNLLRNGKKFVTLPLNDLLYQTIKKNGWRMKYNSSSNYNGRPRKNKDQN